MTSGPLPKSFQTRKFSDVDAPHSSGTERPRPASLLVAPPKRGIFARPLLYLLAQPHDAKLWRLNYLWRGKQNTLSLGAYPEISLAKAREKREALRQQLATGRNPSETRKEAEREARLLEATSFEGVARATLRKAIHVTKGTTRAAHRAAVGTMKAAA